MEIVQRKLEQSATMVHLLAVPVVILLSWLFGTFVVWGSLVVVYVLFCVRQVSDRKIEMYDYMAKDTLDADRESEHAEWLNQFVRKYWVSCVPSLLKPHIANLQKTLEASKPAWLHSLAVGEWAMGARAPRIEVIYPNQGLPDDAMQFDVALHFVSDAFLTIVLTLPTRQSVTIRADGIMFRGNLRCNFKFNTVFPNASVIGVSFVDDPLVEFAIKPLGGIDVISLPTIYDWLQDIIKTQLKPMMVWPQELRFTMGAGANVNAVFGIATIVFGLSVWFPLSLAALFVLGASDMVSVNIRGSLVQLSTPDAMRGRVSAVSMLFIGASNELGEFESGTTAALFGTVPAVVLGGLGTLAIVAVWMKLFPPLRRVNSFSDVAVPH